MIEVTVVRTPAQPVGDWPQGTNSANMFEVRVNDEYIKAFVTDEEAQSLRDRLVAVLSKLQKPLEQIAGLWPDPGMCAEINPKFIGPNDAKMRANLLWAALNLARTALGRPTYARPEHWEK